MRSPKANQLTIWCMTSGEETGIWGGAIMIYNTPVVLKGEGWMRDW